jgi:hypothetical protein
MFLQLGVGNDHPSLSNDRSLVPLLVSQLSQGVLVVSLGEEYSCAIDVAKALYCWGYNRDRALNKQVDSNAGIVWLLFFCIFCSVFA